MLSPHFAAMTDERFQNIPNSTNAVESHNRLSKLSKPEVLCAALLTTYKVDMAAALEHMARLEGLPTSYEDATNDTRAKKNKAVQRCRAKWTTMMDHQTSTSTFKPVSKLKLRS